METVKWFKYGDFFTPFAKKYYSALDGLDRRNGREMQIAFPYCLWYNFPGTHRQIREISVYKKLKSIVFSVGLLLLLLSVVIGYLSIDGLSTITPVEDYLDKGIITFSPYEVTSQQVKNTSASSQERRVLSIPDRGTYVTVGPGQTAESFTAEWRQKYIIILSLSAGYLLLYLLAWCIIWRKNKKERLV